MNNKIEDTFGFKLVDTKTGKVLLESEDISKEEDAVKLMLMQMVKQTKK